MHLGLHKQTVSQHERDARGVSEEVLQDYATLYNVEAKDLRYTELAKVERERGLQAPVGVVREPSPAGFGSERAFDAWYQVDSRWPKGAAAVAARLELAILDGGGSPEAANWARRSLVSPESYLRFYPPTGDKPDDAQVLAQLVFLGELLFEAATGKPMPKEGSDGGAPRSSRKTR